MSTQPTITAALIVKNEAPRLRTLLPQLHWVDEIVVVDSQSTDETVRVAERFGAKVVVHEFDTFAKQRNRASAMATGDWVLSIDADESPCDKLPEEIRQAVRSDRVAAYQVPIRSRIFGEPIRRCGTQDDVPVRLFRRTAARWQGDVHEVLQVTGRIGRLRYWLDHETLPNLAAFLEKMHRYTSLEAKARIAAEKPPRRLAAWIGPVREVLRRLIYKRGLLDGPVGWRFCLLSGLSEWILAIEHRRLWNVRLRQESMPDETPCTPVETIVEAQPPTGASVKEHPISV